MMNIAIYFETSKATGRVHHQNIKLIEIFQKYLSKELRSLEQKKIIDEIGSKSIVF